MSLKTIFYTISITILITIVIIGSQLYVANAKMVIRRGKHFDMCSLAKELHRLGVSSNEIPDWVCIALHESSYNTRAKKVNRDKSTCWGIFQINDKKWCEPPHGNGNDDDNDDSNMWNSSRDLPDMCGVECTKLATDDITAAVECARHIKESNKKGFGNWASWRNKCQYHKPDVKICFNM